MRVSTQVLVDRSLQRLHGRLQSFEDSQTKLATGRQFQTSSEDVSGMNTALALRSERRSVEQAIRNAGDGSTRINLADTKLQQMLGGLRRARDLTIRASSTLQPAERNAISLELDTITDEMAELANSNFLGHGLFSGFSSADAVSSTAGVWSFDGDNSDVERRISQTEVVAVNVVGSEIFGFNAGSNMFDMLEQLSADVVAGDTTVISGRLNDLDAASQRLEGGLAKLGAVGTRIETALGVNLESDETLRKELSAVEDVDLAEAILEIQTQEIALQATLGSLARAIQPSLLQYLR
jgi:flagellar hook-associated protein 3 FlgL